MSKLIGRKVKVISKYPTGYNGLKGEIYWICSDEWTSFPLVVVFPSGVKESFKPNELCYLNNKEVNL